MFFFLVFASWVFSRDISRYILVAFQALFATLILFFCMVHVWPFIVANPHPMYSLRALRLGCWHVSFDWCFVLLLYIYLYLHPILPLPPLSIIIYMSWPVSMLSLAVTPDICECVSPCIPYFRIWVLLVLLSRWEELYYCEESYPRVITEIRLHRRLSCLLSMSLHIYTTRRGGLS